MQSRLRRSNRHQWIIHLLLASFALRALIPQGFMPSPDSPLTLQICPDGFPAHLLPASPASPHTAHHEHGSHHENDAQADPASHDSSEPSHRHPSSSSPHCLFGAASNVGPAPHAPVTASALITGLLVLPAPTEAYSTLQRNYLPQPRAPPALS